MRYDLVDLRLFVHVAEERNLSRGAERSHIAPSSASMRIRGLEEAVGCELLLRGARGVEPTAAGRVLLAHARRCLAQLEQMHVELAPYAQGVTSQVRLFANNNALSAFLPEDLAGFLADHPQVRVSLTEMTSDGIVAAVATGRADVGVVAWVRDTAGLRFLPYREDELVLVLAPDHPLAGQSALRFADCLAEPFISLMSGAAIHTFLASIAASIGRRIDVRAQVSAYDGVVRLVAAGTGVAIVPRAVLAAHAERVAVVRLDEPWAVRRLKICLRVAGPEAGGEGAEGVPTGAMAERLAAHLQARGAASATAPRVLAAA